MGVTGLLQQLKDIQRKTTLTEYKGKTLAVDTYGWLHRGLILCAQDLCTDNPARGYVTSVMKKVDMLRHFGVEPYMVFDGSPLPTKEGTHVERRKRREKAREAATIYLKKGDRKSAWKEFMKAAEVTPEMAKSVMIELDRKHVKYVIAPYEADPQMVYLEKIGAVDGILSEDSDLLVFGCRRLLTKLNDYGECVEIDRERLAEVSRLSLHTFSASQWRLVAILSGCDYTKGVPGIGLKTAFNLVRKLVHLEEIVASLKADNKQIPDDFLEEAVRADLAFQFQKVFDPIKKQSGTLCELPVDEGIDFDLLELCCGRLLPEHIHVGICQGKLHPESHETLISREQNLLVKKSISMSAKLPMPLSVTEPAKSSQSFTHSKSIASYFRTEKSLSVKRVVEISTTGPDKVPKLSPCSKKVKRLQKTSVAQGTKSKFFSATLVRTQIVQPSSPNTDDSHFLTGDSEVPETSSPSRSSPLKMHNPISNAEQYLTDDDEDFPSLPHSVSTSDALTKSLSSLASARSKEESDNDEGFQDGVSDSPEKLLNIGASWRDRFSFGSGANSSIAQAAKASKQTFASESSENSLTPATPEEYPTSRPRQEHASQLASLSICESPDEVSMKPAVLRRPTLNLRDFAFTGK